MIANLGFTALLLILALNLFLPIICCFYNKNLINNKQNIELEKISIFVTLFTLLLALLAQFSLIYCYIISDYSVVNVYQNSHHLKPLIYKISGSWGNHEGSMLLLITILSAHSTIFALFNKSEFKIIALASQSFIIFAFTVFTAFASNPFEISFNFSNEGLGLNPLLQDIGLALHPPILYLGYIGFFMAFSLAISGLLKEKINNQLAKNIQPWLFASWSFLTAGIGLGSWWAYRELGWGGYWFWDPVENVSLMPWLASTALIHSVKILNKNQEFKVWTILLAIITFILCLIGIFLVRSGLLTSVHSFAVDAKRGFFIIILIALIGGISLLIFSLKINKIINNVKIDKNKFLSKQSMILINNYILMIALFTMLLGIFYPIFAREFFAINLSIGAEYYNKIFAILLLPFLCFLIFSYFTKIKKIADFCTKKNILFLFLSSFITILTYFNANNLTIISALILLFSLLLFFIAFFSKKSVSNIAHFSFSLILIGIILNSFLGITKEINIKQSQEIALKENSEIKIKFTKIDFNSGKNFISRVGIFDIKNNNKIITQLKPELRYYPISDQTTFEADIFHNFFGDLYLAIGNKDEQENYALRIYYKPFIYLIWIGCLLMAFSGFLKIFIIIITTKNNQKTEIS